MQVNLNTAQNGGDFPFLNLMKSGQQWSLVSNVSPYVVEPSNLDNNGWPKVVPAGSNGITTAFFVPLQSERSGNYVCKWTGDGTAYVAAGDTAIAYTITAASIATQCVLQCSTGVGNNPFNVRVGQPIAVSGISGTGWGGIVANWPVLAVDIINHTITIGFNSSSLSAPTLSSARVTNVKNTTVSGGLAGQGRYVFSTVYGGINAFNIGVATVNSTSNYPTNMIVCHEDDEALIDAGQIFGGKFLATLKAPPFGVIRFLNYQLGNACQVTNWASRKPVNYAYYGGDELRPSAYCGFTANSGNAYTTAIFPPGGHSSDGTAWTSGPPKQGDTVIVTINASATQSGLCSLDIGGLGNPFNILNSYSNPLTAGGNSYPIGGSYLSIACLVFDATLNAWIKKGGSADWSACGIGNGVPYEIMVALCAAVGGHPYFISPPFALDPATDFLPSLSTYCQANSPTWMIPRFEGPNELWNTAGGFTQTTYAQNKRAVFNGSTTPGGVLTTTSYSVSGFTYPSTLSGIGFADITLSTAGNSFIVGSLIVPAALGGLTNLPSSGFYVSAINVGGNPNKITVQYTPTGTYTSGGTVTPSLTDYNNWYGQAISVIGQACAATYGQSNLGSKYWVLAGVQTGSGTSTSQSNPRLNSTSYVLANNPQSPYVASAAFNWVSHVVCAQYMSPSLYGTTSGSPNESAMSATFAAVKCTASIVNGVVTIASTSFGTIATGLDVFGQNIALSAGVTVVSGSGSTWTLSDLTINMSLNSLYMGNDSTGVLEAYIDTLNSGSGSFNLPNLNTLYKNWYAWAQGFTNGNGTKLGLTGYEGGYSTDYTSGGSSQLDIFRYATKFVASTPNNATGLQGYYATNLANFKAAGGVFPSEFQLSGKYPTNGAWQVLENIYQTPDPPQWAAIKAFH